MLALRGLMLGMIDFMIVLRGLMLDMNEVMTATPYFSIKKLIVS
ncbi:hypothetical protein GGGNBK_09230 [Sporosarcina sp. ANT_H38]|nr:hypothetical protein [Sporosarcina sp. ANT_H38]